MKKWLLLCLLSVCFNQLQAQETTKIFKWEDALKANPDSVFAIDASKLKWQQVPEELKQFKQLRFLNLSKNKIKELPEFIAEFKWLKVLDLTKNELFLFPVQLCKMNQLQKIHLSRNKIESIPACIQYMAELRVLDIWDNPITSLPEEVTKLEKLEAVDMRGIMLTPEFQEKWLKQMPDVKWYFDAPCHCVN